MPRFQRVMTFAVGALLWAQVGHANPTAQSLEVPTDDDGAECPELLRGVDVSMVVIPGGATLEFKTLNNRQGSDLRFLLREAAATIEYHSKLAALHPELVDASDDVLPPVDISVKEITPRLRMTIRAEQRADTKVVLAKARELVAGWNKNRCTRRDAPVRRSTTPPNVATERA